MGQRLVLKSEGGKVLLSDLRAFVKKCDEFNMPNGTELDSEGDVTLGLSLPKDQRVVKGRRVRVKGKTKQGRAAEDQIEKHKQDKKEGNKQGYVPPAGRNKAPAVPKIACPVCGTRKQVVTIGAVKSVKPHTVKGKECGGSGVQVIGSGRKMKTVNV
jgi:hypothetical protein